MISLWEGCGNDFPLSNFKTCPSETTLDKSGLLRPSYQVLPGSFCLLSLLTLSGSWVHLQILLVIVTWQIIPSQTEPAYSSQAPLTTPGDRIRQLWAPCQAIVESQAAMQTDENTFMFGKYFSSSCYSNLDYNYKVMRTKVKKKSDVFLILSMMEFIAIHGDWLGNRICPKMS